MLERDVEKKLVTTVKRAGGIAYKFSSPQRRDVPDRLVLMPHGVFQFIECKATGKDLRPGQVREHKRMIKLGHQVITVDSVETVYVAMEVIHDEVRRAVRLTNEDKE